MSDEPPPLPRPSTAPPPTDLECPRCGYDLQGQAQGPAGPHAQPSGICAECGLEFRWDEVTDLARRRRLDIFEHAGGRLVKNFWITYRKTFAPWRFWRWMRMEHDVAFDRLMIFAFIAPLLSTLLIGAVVLLLRFAASGPYWDFPDTFNIYVVADYGNLLVIPSQVLLVLTTGILPLTFVLLPETLRKAKVRNRHLCRGALYSLAMPTALGAAPSLVVPIWHWARQSWAGTYYWNLPTYWTFEWFSATCVLWQLLWWGFFAGRYCRLPRPWLIAAAMVLVSWLIAMLLILPTGLLSDVLSRPPI